MGLAELFRGVEGLLHGQLHIRLQGTDDVSCEAIVEAQGTVSLCQSAGRGLSRRVAEAPPRRNAWGTLYCCAHLATTHPQLAEEHII